MRIHLAGVETLNSYFKEYPAQNHYTLTTFYHWRKKKELPKFLYYDSTLIDSGAFSFFGGRKVDWNDYTSLYINFINTLDKKYFFELDIDKIVGVDEALTIRKRIEKETGKQPIPVWHPIRGMNAYRQMCKDYDYIALSLSGLYDSSWIKDDKGTDVIKGLIYEANTQGTKVHGLGYTKARRLHLFNFYSCDSTTWVGGMKFGNIVYFDGSRIRSIKRPPNTKMINPRKRLLHNYKEWIKYQLFADAGMLVHAHKSSK